MWIYDDEYEYLLVFEGVHEFMILSSWNLPNTFNKYSCGCYCYCVRLFAGNMTQDAGMIATYYTIRHDWPYDFFFKLDTEIDFNDFDILQICQY